MTKTRIGWMANMHKKNIRKKQTNFLLLIPSKPNLPKSQKVWNKIMKYKKTGYSLFPKQNVNSTLLMIKLMENDALWTWGESIVGVVHGVNFLVWTVENFLRLMVWWYAKYYWYLSCQIGLMLDGVSITWLGCITVFIQRQQFS